MKKNLLLEELKRKIIESSKRSFIEKGYEATQIKDMIKDARATQGLFFYFFDSKEHVFDIIVDEYANNIIEMMEELFSCEVATIDKLFGILDILMSSAKNEGMLFNEIVIIDRRVVPESFYTSLERRMLPIVFREIEKANLRGEFKCNYPLQTTQIMVNGILSILKEVPYDKKVDFIKSNMCALKEIIRNIYNIKEENT